MKTLFRVLFLSLISLTSFAQVQTFKGDSTAPAQANRVNIGANAIGRPGFKLSTGNFKTFATTEEVQAASAGGVLSVNNVTPTSGNVNITYANLLSKPTTRSGFGLTDAEGTITAGTTSQYWRGDKTFQTLDKSAVGLPNLTNALQVINAGGLVSLGSGLLSARPTAGTAGRSYYATDTKTNFYDTGSAWEVQEPAITGDVTIAAGATSAVLPTVNSNVGTFGSGTAVPAVTVNAKGQITGVSTNTITPAGIGAAAVATSLYYDKVATYSALSSYTVPANQVYLIKVATDESQSAPYSTNQFYIKDDTGAFYKFSLIKQ